MITVNLTPYSGFQWYDFPWPRNSWLFATVRPRICLSAIYEIITRHLWLPFCFTSVISRLTTIPMINELANLSTVPRAYDSRRASRLKPDCLVFCAIVLTNFGRDGFQCIHPVKFITCLKEEQLCQRRYDRFEIFKNKNKFITRLLVNYRKLSSPSHKVIDSITNVLWTNDKHRFLRLKRL